MPENFHQYLARHRDEEFFDDSHLLEPIPTATLRGSPERVEVYRERVERGEQLYHPGDSLQTYKTVNRPGKKNRFGDN